MIINIDIVKKRPSVAGTPVIVCGNSGYTIEFTFDDEWATHTDRTARFVYTKKGKNEYKDVPFTGSTVAVPVLSGIREVSVGVYAGDLQTTTPARIPCVYSILCNSGEDATTGEDNPTLQEQIGDLSKLQTTAKGNLVDAINEVAKTGGTGSGSGEGSSGGSGSDSGQNPTQTVACENLDLFYSALIRRKANPNEPLAITTYPGGADQPTHPKVLYFANGWNGHKYWMVYTPYPNNNSFQENPCITYSDDGINWSEEGISNPIIASQGGGWWSDPHLVYIPETNTLEMWVRWCSTGADGMENGWEGVYRLKSTDGVNWTEKEYLYHVVDTAWASVLSPSVIYEDGKYKIWFVYKRECLKYYESTDGTNWQYVKDISVNLTPLGNYKLWHFDMIKTTKGYEFVGCYQINGQFDRNNYIAYSWSVDNQTYTPAVCVLANGASGQFDDLELYRPCLVKVGNKYRMYYGAQKNIRIWHIGMVEAPNMGLLHELLKQYSGVVLPSYEGADSGDGDTSITATNFSESTWTSGYYNDRGVIDTALNMHHSDLMPIATAGGTVSTTVSGDTLLRISYFDADYTHLGYDKGNGFNETTTNYAVSEIEVLTNIEGAVYYAISCNTTDKSTVSVTANGSDSGETEKTLISISATYSGGDVAVGTAVTALSGIVVTAHYSDGTSGTVTGYTLSGTIAEGENTVTVSYGGKTATITVTGIAYSGDDGITAVVNSFEESAWTEGYYYDKGVLKESGKVYLSSFVVLPSEVQYVHCKNTSNVWMCVTYWDADKNYLGYDRGNGMNADNNNGGTLQTIALRTDVENAAYYTVSAFAEKADVYVDSRPDVVSASVAANFTESQWLKGYYNDNGVLTTALNMYHSDYLPIATAGGTVSTTLTKDSYLRISYFDADFNYLEYDNGGGYNSSSIAVKTDTTNAVYYTINCNTADKSAVSVT